MESGQLACQAWGITLAWSSPAGFAHSLTTQHIVLCPTTDWGERRFTGSFVCAHSFQCIPYAFLLLWDRMQTWNFYVSANKLQEIVKRCCRSRGRLWRYLLPIWCFTPINLNGAFPFFCGNAHSTLYLLTLSFYSLPPSILPLEVAVVVCFACWGVKVHAGLFGNQFWPVLKPLCAWEASIHFCYGTSSRLTPWAARGNLYLYLFGWGYVNIE